MGYDIQWEGIEELDAVFARAASRAPEVSINILKNNNEEMKDHARSISPIDTGFLRDNIFTQYNGDQAYTISGAGYSGFLEYGTRNMSAQPYMRPALEAQAPKFEDQLKQAAKGLFK